MSNKVHVKTGDTVILLTGDKLRFGKIVHRFFAVTPLFTDDEFSNVL